MENAPCDRGLVTIGGSEGGVNALKQVTSRLPHDLPAAVVVVIQVSADFRSSLPLILDRLGPLRAAHARDGDRIETSRIYVAPPDYHMFLRTGGVRLSRGPRENSVRPAIDRLFRSAARSFGSRVTAVLLTGGLSDGGVAVRNFRERQTLARHS
jgi:two-component system chemotaxis response regulator CheB